MMTVGIFTVSYTVNQVLRHKSLSWQPLHWKQERRAVKGFYFFLKNFIKKVPLFRFLPDYYIENENSAIR